MSKSRRDPEQDALEELETEIVEDLDVEVDADEVVGGNDFTLNWRCNPT